MHAEQVVADMVEEVLAARRQFVHDGAGSRWRTRLTLLCVPRPVGRQLQELRDGPHGSERADEWQEHLVRSRAEARADLIQTRVARCEYDRR